MAQQHDHAQPLDFEAVYAMKMQALMIAEGRRPPDLSRFDYRKPELEDDLDGWMIEVLKRASKREGFATTCQNFRAIGCPYGNENQRMSPLVTRGLVYVDKTVNPRRAHITNEGRRVLKERTANG